MNSHSNRGKEAEALLKRHLGLICADQKKQFMRFPDARAGSMQATVSDFLFMFDGVTTFIECKQVNHEFRLPYANFDTAQVGRLRLWGMAGARSIVLVYHAPLKLWRGYSVARFVDRAVGGSWDLRDTTPLELSEIFRLKVLEC